jgi:hypothetical protein
MQASATQGATPQQLAAEFKAARQAKVDQFQALMKVQQLPSNGGAVIPPPRSTISGIGGGPQPPGGPAFGGGCSAASTGSVFGQPAAPGAAAASSPFGQPPAAGFGAAAPFGAATPQVQPCPAPLQLCTTCA